MDLIWTRTIVRMFAIFSTPAFIQVRHWRIQWWLHNFLSRHIKKDTIISKIIFVSVVMHKKHRTQNTWHRAFFREVFKKCFQLFVKKSPDKVKKWRKLARLRRIKRFFWIFSKDFLFEKIGKLKIFDVMFFVLRTLNTDNWTQNTETRTQNTAN